MISLQVGIVTSITETADDITFLEVRLSDESVGKAIAYHSLTGLVEVGDQVIVNCTAEKLQLGSGGYHFVVANMTKPSHTVRNSGHIMKLKYTPLQFSVLTAEEEESEFHSVIRDGDHIENTPVIVGSLHSMLAPAALGVKLENKNLNIAYIMTDRGALPLALSKITKKLKDEGIISKTITIGDAFGGDYEAVNIYSALLLAVHGLKADVIIVAMGPGIVGTGTKWGFSGVEQGEILNAVNIMKGKAIAIPRIMFNDPRPRHAGLSHHTITILSQVALRPCYVSLPLLAGEKEDLIKSQVSENKLDQMHKFIPEDGAQIFSQAQKHNINMKVMGRSPEREPEYFAAAGAAGIAAAKLATAGLI